MKIKKYINKTKQNEYNNIVLNSWLTTDDNTIVSKINYNEENAYTEICYHTWLIIKDEYPEIVNKFKKNIYHKKIHPIKIYMILINYKQNLSKLLFIKKFEI